MKIRQRNRFISFGLLPIIGTMIGIRFFPSTIVLGAGTLVSICTLVFNILKFRDLNYFLLLSSVSIGLCYAARVTAGYMLIPQGTTIPILELILFVFTSIYLLLPDINGNILRIFRLKSNFSYIIETRIIVILTFMHLIILIVTGYIFRHPWEMDAWGQFMYYDVPVLIYLTCFLINAIGIRIVFNNCFKCTLIRIAPIYNKQIYLIRRKINDCYNYRDSISLWDLPIEEEFKGLPENSEKYARKIAGKDIYPNEIGPRQILKYQSGIQYEGQQPVALYVYPLDDVQEIKSRQGRFFTFEELNEMANEISPSLQLELQYLKMTAEVWGHFGTIPPQ